MIYFLFSGQAEIKFEGLKRRYRSRKLAVRKAKPSGTGRTTEVIKAEAALAAYDFLKWLDPFLQGAESLSNMDAADENSQEEEMSRLESRPDVSDDENLSDSDESEQEDGLLPHDETKCMT